MMQWTIGGACLVTLTLFSVCSSVSSAERELLPSLVRLERQAGNQAAVDRRPAPSNENVRFARRPEASGSFVEQRQSGQIALSQADPNLRQELSSSANQQAQRLGQVNSRPGQPRVSSARSQGSQVSNSKSQRQLLDYPDNLPLTQMTPEMLENFLASEEDVIILTNCFENFRTCRSKHGINLIKQLRELGIGGRCEDCTSQEQERLDELIYEFIQKFISRYPKHWRRIVPNIGKFLVPRRPDA